VRERRCTYSVYGPKRAEDFLQSVAGEENPGSGRLRRQSRRLFHLSRQREIERADATGVMRCEVDHDSIKDVEPFGMMVLLLGHQRAGGHEAECFREVAELVLSVQLAVVKRPAGQLLQSGLSSPTSSPSRAARRRAVAKGGRGSLATILQPGVA
jgi:hypothetical protein